MSPYSPPQPPLAHRCSRGVGTCHVARDTCRSAAATHVRPGSGADASSRARFCRRACLCKPGWRRGRHLTPATGAPSGLSTPGGPGHGFLCGGAAAARRHALCGTAGARQVVDGAVTEHYRWAAEEREGMTAPDNGNTG